MAEDLGERTEQPTAKRLQEARESGNVARSSEFNSAIMLCAATITTAVVLLPALGRFKGMLEAALGSGEITTGAALQSAQAAFAVGVRVALPIMLSLAGIAFVLQFLQVGWSFTPGLLAPKLSQLNPLRGLSRLFSLNGFVRAGMSIAKVVIIGLVVGASVWHDRFDIVALAGLSSMQALLTGGHIVLNLALRLLVVLLLLGAADLFYQRWKHREGLRMTRHQVRDELKQSEGDPQVKRRRFRMQQQIAMQRINAAVPKADVVVTNPQHISVALRYDAERMRAPTLIAKGADLVALRIRQIALLNEVPIVARPPLARSLYKQVAVGQEVPPDFYHAVAEVLAYVYQLGARKAG